MSLYVTCKDKKSAKQTFVCLGAWLCSQSSSKPEMYLQSLESLGVNCECYIFDGWLIGSLTLDGKGCAQPLTREIIVWTLMGVDSDDDL